jgi:hypothetical protein|tara:strand:- start:5210 stop:5590 length:381 start_codon:yes stop_codon:yes gene_type:complete
MTSRKLQTLWDEEVETELYRRTIKVMEKISYKYSINLKLLLSEIPNPLNFCRGFKKDGSPCIARAKLNGMCGSHIDQPQLRGPVEMVSKNNEGIRHTHNLTECIFKPGCPACEVSRKGFRELRGIM